MRTAAGVFIEDRVAVGVALVVVFEHEVFGKGHCLGLAVFRGDRQAFLGLVPVVRIAGIHVVLVVRHQRIEHLDAGLLLPGHDAGVFALLDALIDEADLKVGFYRTVVIDRFGLCAFDLGVRGGLSEQLDGLIEARKTFGHAHRAGALAVLCADADADGTNEAGLGEGAGDRSLGDADVGQEYVAAWLFGVINVHKGGAVAGDQQRCEQGKEDDEQDDDRRCDGSLVLAEADPCVLEIADGLIFELLVAQATVFLYQREFLTRDIVDVDRLFHFFDPILIRGSIKP